MSKITPHQAASSLPVQPTPAAPTAGRAANAPAMGNDSFVRSGREVKTEGIHDGIFNHLPRFVGMAAYTVSHFPLMAFKSLKDKFFPPEAASKETTGGLERAKAVMADTHAQFGIPGLAGDFQERAANGDAPKTGLVDGVKAWAKNGTGATVWPYGQAIAGELDIAAQTGDYSGVDTAMTRLQRYWDGEAYRPGQMGGARFWDDNAWLGLDLMQAYAQTGNKSYLEQVEKMVPWMKSGLRQDGGIYWREHEKRMSLNTCANGPTIQMFLRLYQATKKPEYLDLAKNLDAAMNKELRDPKTGLYWDNKGDDGSVSKDIYSYNQGTPVGADVLWYKTTGDKSYLERATQTANAALDYYGKDDRLWKSSPAFNAIFFRNLLQLDQVAPNPRIREALNQYADRLWKEGRDPKTGLFNQNGMGTYGGGHATDVLDQGGIAQIFALQSMTPEQLANIN